jgi:predicted RNase H-like nuclease (RuvC/YqgF family)
MKGNWLVCLNFIGGLLLAGLCVIQWFSDEIKQEKLVVERVEKNKIILESAKISERNQVLEMDVSDLKLSISQLKKEAEEALAQQNKIAEETETSVKQITDFSKKTLEWEAAIKQRDQAILELNTTLLATRKRLDEAVSRLEKIRNQRK